MITRQTVKKKCGRCGKKYEQHKDYDDHGIKLCLKCFIEFYDEQKILRKDKREELEKLTRYWKNRNGLGDNKRLEIAESNLLHHKKNELEKECSKMK